MTSVLNHIYILVTIFFTVYSQIIMRWQVGLAGSLPGDLHSKFYFILGLLAKPWVISALIASFLAGISWMMALTKFEISYAYPWAAMNFVLVFLLATFFFAESITVSKLVGIILIVFGIVVLAKSTI